jgi:hypothetical protein
MGTAPSRWPRFARVLRRHALIDEMMEAQGVDLLASRAMRSSRRGRIAAIARMRRPAGPGSWSAGEPADFCPNGEFFASLKREE